MSLSIGIVGLPNVGKSTLFNAILGQQQALAANYPFATIEPNIGIATVPDERLAVLAKIVHTSTIKPATIELVDIAGLVKGASQGEGLGNKFLSHIKQTSAIAHVLRVFQNPDIIRDTPVDPQADLQTIRTELQISDLEILDRQTPPKGAVSPTAQKRFDTITAFRQTLNQGQSLNVYLATLPPEEQTAAFTLANELNLLTHKPEIFVLNVDEADLAHTDELIKTWSQKLHLPQKQVVVVSAQVESELSSLSPEEQALFLKELGISEYGLARLARVAYRTLGLQSFLTAGELEVKAWTIPQGTTAVNAAGVIHTDFIKNFIKAKVIAYDDFVAYQGWKKASDAGKVRLEGRDYIMRPDDVVEVIINK
ncbi:redox-regulated ATPase YchF [bacterium]|nr:redox-regulated ATPase YchF [bacterium]